MGAVGALADPDLHPACGSRHVRADRDASLVNATVTHTAGGNSFTMADTGGTNFTGTVDASGAFAANAVFGPDGTGQTYTQRLQGRFTTGGFSADLSVDVAPRSCNFTRGWTATKQGSPNVIP